MKKLIVLCLILTMALSFGVVSFGAEEDTTVTIGLSAEPTYLLNIYNGNKNGVPICNLIYDGLTAWDSEAQEAVPCIAKSWEQIEPCVWRFYLRDDVIAYDGTTITANDVYYTFVQGCASAFVNSWKYFDADLCAVVDDYTVDIGTKTEIADLPQVLADNALHGIISESSVESNGGYDACIRDPKVGSGPYKFVEWKDAEYIILERNEDYWGEKPYYQTIKMRFIKDSATRVMSLEAGDVEIITDVLVSQAASLDENSAFTLVQSTPEQTYALAMTTTVAPFDNVLVRKAIAHLINQDAVLMVAYGGYGLTQDTSISPVDKFYVDPSDDLIYSYDIDAAKKLLEEAGYPNGFECTLTLQSGFDNVGTIIQESLAQAGITVNIETLDTPTYMATSFEGGMTFTVTTIVDGGNYYNSLQYYDSRKPVQAVGTGWTGWGSVETDALIDTLISNNDDSARAEAMNNLLIKLREEVPMVGLVNFNTLTATVNNITGISLDSRGLVSFRNIRPVE